MPERLSERSHDRFTARLEAFSDLVFGFSLSLLATRLDVPAQVADIFDSTRLVCDHWAFGLVCRFWLEHYRIFRHRFVARMFDAIVNFVFLFAIAVLPYAVQTLLRFTSSISSFGLYVADFSLILLTLSTLRVRNLRQRRDDPDVADRLRDWRRSLIQFAFAFLAGGMLLALQRHGGSVQSGLRDLNGYILRMFVATILLSRTFVRRLPGFLA